MNKTPASPKRRRSLYGRVVGAMVLVWAMLVGIGAWRSWEDRAARIERDDAETANLSRSLAQYAHDAILAADTAVVDMRGMIEIEGTTPHALKHIRALMANQLAASPIVGTFVIFDAAGNWIVNSSAVPPYTVLDRAYFQYHRSHTERDIHIGEPIHGRGTGRWVITVSRRIDAPDGSFAGVMLATLRVDTFLKFYEKFDLSQEGIIGLLSTDGIVVTRTHSKTDPTGVNLSDKSFFRKFLSQPSPQTLDYVSELDGVHRIGSSRPMEDFPFVILVAHGFDEALAGWRQETRINGAVGLAASLVVLLLGIRLARQVRRSERAEAALSDSESHYRLIAENSTDVIVRLDAGLRRTYVSPSMEALTGYRLDELLGRHSSEIIHPDDWPAVAENLALAVIHGEAAAISFRFVCKDGIEVWVERTGRHIEETGCYVMTLRDATRRKQAEARLNEANNMLQRLVMQDGLTGIANRRCLDLTLQKELRRQARGDMPMALLLVDVDNFKKFNDLYGHSAGDACLRAIAEAMAAQTNRPADLVARFGGEEFAIVLPETDAPGAMALAERVRAAVCRLGIAHRHNVDKVATISVGVAVGWPRRHSLTAESLIERADKALYQAKDGGRNQVALAVGSSRPSATEEGQPPGEVVALEAF